MHFLNDCRCKLGRMQVLAAPTHVHGLGAFGLEIVGYIGNAAIP